MMRVKFSSWLGTDPRFKGIIQPLKARFFGGNLGHAALKITVPDCQQVTDLLKELGDTPLPYKIEWIETNVGGKIEIQKAYSFYLSFWPNKSEDPNISPNAKLKSILSNETSDRISEWHGREAEFSDKGKKLLGEQIYNLQSIQNKSIFNAERKIYSGVNTLIHLESYKTILSVAKKIREETINELNEHIKYINNQKANWSSLLIIHNQINTQLSKIEELRFDHNASEDEIKLINNKIKFLNEKKEAYKSTLSNENTENINLDSLDEVKKYVNTYEDSLKQLEERKLFYQNEDNFYLNNEDAEIDGVFNPQPFTQLINEYLAEEDKQIKLIESLPDSLDKSVEENKLMLLIQKREQLIQDELGFLNQIIIDRVGMLADKCKFEQEQIDENQDKNLTNELKENLAQTKAQLNAILPAYNLVMSTSTEGVAPDSEISCEGSLDGSHGFNLIEIIKKADYIAKNENWEVYGTNCSSSAWRAMQAGISDKMQTELLEETDAKKSLFSTDALIPLTPAAVTEKVATIQSKMDTLKRKHDEEMYHANIPTTEKIYKILLEILSNQILNEKNKMKLEKLISVAHEASQLHFNLITEKETSKDKYQDGMMQLCNKLQLDNVLSYQNKSALSKLQREISAPDLHLDKHSKNKFISKVKSISSSVTKKAINLITKSSNNIFRKLTNRMNTKKENKLASDLLHYKNLFNIYLNATGTDLENVKKELSNSEEKIRFYLAKANIYKTTSHYDGNTLSPNIKNLLLEVGNFAHTHVRGLEAQALSAIPNQKK